MRELECPEVREMAPDVALGLLTGEERAAALGHLEGCTACRAEVATLASVADEVLLTAPDATPPEGFDRRVLDLLAAERSALATPEEADVRPHRRGPARRPRRAAGVAVAAAAAVALVAAVATTLVTRGGDAPSETTAPMTTSAGEVVGEATVHDGDPTMVDVALPGWEFPPYVQDYWLAIELDGGERMMAHLTTEDTWWEVPVEAAADEVTAVSLLDGNGRVWCSAEFPV